MDAEAVRAIPVKRVARKFSFFHIAESAIVLRGELCSYSSYDKTFVSCVHKCTSFWLSVFPIIVSFDKIELDFCDTFADGGVSCRSYFCSAGRASGGCSASRFPDTDCSSQCIVNRG